MNGIPHVTDVNIGQRIRLRRTELGLSMATLGERVGVTSQQISKYELGKHRCYASKLHEIAAALGVTLLYFFEHTHLAADDDGREVLELLKSYREIKDPTNRRRLRDLARALYSENPS